MTDRRLQPVHAIAVELAELAAALASLVATATLEPYGIEAGALAIDARHEAGLHPDESAIIELAVARRRAEFATGRALLRGLIGAPGPVLTLTSRAPSVPLGVVASLAHDREFAVAAVHRNAATRGGPHVVALGIDIEPAGSVDTESAAVVLRPDEQSLDPTMAFVAKEAAYKAWSTSGGAVLDHADVRITCSPGDLPQEFAAEFLGTSTIVRGVFTRTSTRWLALAVLDAPR